MADLRHVRIEARVKTCAASFADPRPTPMLYAFCLPSTNPSSLPEHGRAHLMMYGKLHVPTRFKP